MARRTRTDVGLPISLVDVLCAELLEAICSYVHDDDAPCLRLSCTALYEADRPTKRKPAFKGAMFHSVERARWALAHCPLLAQERILPMNWAASAGSVETLRYLRHEQRLEWNEFTMSAAARAGRLPAAQWLRRNGCPWNVSTCTLAAHGGHLQFLQWAWQSGCRWSENTCSEAAGGGHLSTLQWLRAKGCPWGTGTCSAAADGGHLEVLKWAREHGCPWDEDTYYGAMAQGESSEIFRWVQAN